MEENLVICIPGNWENRSEFLQAVVTSTSGDFMFAGGILAHPKGKNHVALEFYDSYEEMTESIEYGGQGKISRETLDKIDNHKSVVYLSFPFDIISQKERIAKFTKVISQCGGIAVKIETSGAAHEWERWFELIESDNPFDQYCASVVLVSDENHYYSCGMQNFGLPDSQISNLFDIEESADLINRFNNYLIFEKPNIKSGHTFSWTIESPHFRLELIEDTRHESDDLFYNPNGIWNLEKV